MLAIGLWFLAYHQRGDARSRGTPQSAEASARPLAASTVAPAGAARNDRSTDAGLRSAPVVRSPAETAGLLQTLHKQRDYAAIAPLVVADRRGGMLDTLMAIDEVLSANDELQDAARQAYGGVVTGLWDLSAMENNLGPLSAKVTIINQSFVGDTATVILQEGDNVPLARVQFDWTSEGWQYRPEGTPVQMLPELSRLACILREVAESVKGGASFDVCFDAFAERVFPQMHRIVTAGEQQPAIVASGVPDAAE